MAGTFGRGDPTPVIVRQMVAGGTGGATNARRHPVVVVSVPVPQDTVTSDGTGNGGFVSWINPEVGTIMVTGIHLTWNTIATTGTGTFDVGTSSDGTGTNATVFDGATMDGFGLAAFGTAATHGTLNSTAGFITGWRLGPGGTGTFNSLVGRTTEVTSTAAGRMLITYIALDT